MTKIKINSVYLFTEKANWTFFLFLQLFTKDEINLQHNKINLHRERVYKKFFIEKVKIILEKNTWDWNKKK